MARSTTVLPVAERPSVFTTRSDPTPIGRNGWVVTAGDSSLKVDAGVLGKDYNFILQADKPPAPSPEEDIVEEETKAKHGERLTVDPGTIPTEQEGTDAPSATKSKLGTLRSVVERPDGYGVEIFEEDQRGFRLVTEHVNPHLADQGPKSSLLSFNLVGAITKRVFQVMWVGCKATGNAISKIGEFLTEDEQPLHIGVFYQCYNQDGFPCNKIITAMAAGQLPRPKHEGDRCDGLFAARF